MSERSDDRSLRQSLLQTASVPPAAPRRTPQDGEREQVTSRRRAGGKRKPLSCLACRNHKLRCDRRVPCGTCVRYHREAQCRQNPAPSVVPSRRKKRTQTATLQGSPSKSRPVPDNVAHNPYVPERADDCSRARDSSPEDGSHIGEHTDTVGARIAEQFPGTQSALDGLSLLTAFDMEPSTWPSLHQLLAEAAHGEHHSSTWDSMIDFQYRRKLAQQQLSSVLPSRSQSDLLLNFFLEHINWIFQTVHEPSFRRDYARFWEQSTNSMDFIWTSLLFTILSVSALHVPLEAMSIVGFPHQAIRGLAHIWHLASLHSLRAGDYESKPCLVQLQTYSITQLYWYATNQIELLNSRLGQAVKTAQALRLDRDQKPAQSLGEEMRHRIWWDLVDSDMFQSACLDRPPLIRLPSTGVPFPLNCNDSDLNNNFVHPQSMTEPTEMSMNIFRAETFRILNRHFFQNAAKLDECQQESADNNDPQRQSAGYGSTYEDIIAVDKQLLALLSRLPWYFQVDSEGCLPRLPGPLGERITWQHYILRTCIHTQRIRMYREFLKPRIDTAWQSCIVAAQDMVFIYRSLRSQMTQLSRQKFLPQAYQVFSVAVTVVTMLLVEGSLPIPDVYRQVKNMTTDLGMLESQDCQLPVAMHGRRVLRKLLDLCKTRATLATSTSPEEAQTLVPDISIILGGEHLTRAYINRLHEEPPHEGITTVCSPQQRHIQKDTGTWGHETMRPHDDDNHEVPQVSISDSAQVAIADLGPNQPSTESWMIGSIDPDLMQSGLDPTLFLQDDMSLLDLRNWDMTGLLMFESSEMQENPNG